MIAVGDLDMSDAAQRDFLAVNKGVLCVETELGVMESDVPCLVAHGIYNYSISGTNPE